MMRARGLCQLWCGNPGAVTIAGYRVCPDCVTTIRAIAHDAGVTIDEEMLSGSMRKLGKRSLTRAELLLEDNQERRAIAAARSA